MPSICVPRGPQQKGFWLLCASTGVEGPSLLFAHRCVIIWNPVFPVHSKQHNMYGIFLLWRVQKTHLVLMRVSCRVLFCTRPGHCQCQVLCPVGSVLCTTTLQGFIQIPNADWSWLLHQPYHRLIYMYRDYVHQLWRGSQWDCTHPWWREERWHEASLSTVFNYTQVSHLISLYKNLLLEMCTKSWYIINVLEPRWKRLVKIGWGVVTLK